MIVLFTDFGTRDAYVGQMHAVLARAAPGIPVIDLLHNVPRHHARAGAYLLPAYVDEFAEDTVFVCVVDPGVGGPRQPVIVRAFRRWFVGPDNGLFRILCRRDCAHEMSVIQWRPPTLSASFHGRDLFAPVAAQIARGQMPLTSPMTLSPDSGNAWPDDLEEIIYVDHFGNSVCGVRASQVADQTLLRLSGHRITRARTFSAVPRGQAFWYENANGLVEIAVNQGSAAAELQIVVGDKIAFSV